MLVSSPTVSAHLQTARATTVVDEMPDSMLRAEMIPACNACGNLLIDGWSCQRLTSTSKESKRRRKIQGTAKKHHEAMSYQLRCSLCKALTTVRPPTPFIKPSLKDSRPLTVPGLDRTAPSVTAVSRALPTKASETSASSSSRRVRGKQSSLQALLAGQKRPPPPASTKAGLNLMDFMKT